MDEQTDKVADEKQARLQSGVRCLTLRLQENEPQQKPEDAPKQDASQPQRSDELER